MRTIGGGDDREQKRKEREGEEEANRRQECAKKADALKLQPQFDHYTCLLQPRSTILAAIEGTGLLTLPKKADRPIGRNQGEYCRYHRARGHSTDQC